jgi:hypothetical protein
LNELGAMGRYTRVVEMGSEREIHIQPSTVPQGINGLGPRGYQVQHPR